MKSKRPLVYSCSGCSSAAQLSNDLALYLNDKKLAQMSCIAGVGGEVPPLVKLALSDREILTIDGCSLMCTKACLKKIGVKPTYSVVLTDLDITKKNYARYTESEFEKAKSAVLEFIFDKRKKRADS